MKIYLHPLCLPMKTCYIYIPFVCQWADVSVHLSHFHFTFTNLWVCFLGWQKMPGRSPFSQCHSWRQLGLCSYHSVYCPSALGEFGLKQGTQKTKGQHAGKWRGVAANAESYGIISGYHPPDFGRWEHMGKSVTGSCINPDQFRPQPAIQLVLCVRPWELSPIFPCEFCVACMLS